MIINFNIKNFGSIKEMQTLSFEAEKTSHLEDFYVYKSGNLRLLKIALIYGANASGKTTILNALEFLRNLVLNPADKKTEELDFQPYLFNEKTPDENTILSIEFLQNNIKYFYEVEFCKKAVVREILKYYNPKKSVIFSRVTDFENQFAEIKIGGKIKIGKTALNSLEANTLWNNTVLGGFLKTNIEIKELKEVTSWFQNYLFPVIYPKSELASFIISLIDKNQVKKENVLKILQKADLNISNIIIEENEQDIPSGLLELIEKSSGIPENDIIKLKKNKKITAVELKFEHIVNGKKYLLPFDLESQGTKRFYGFAGILSLLITKPGIFAIDELEASIHPDLYLYFLLSFLANSVNSQIIATTHNREILNNRDLIRDDALWITNKTENSETELYSFADFDTSVIRDTSNRLNAYKSGKLGGVPNVGDFYFEFH